MSSHTPASTRSAVPVQPPAELTLLNWPLAQDGWSSMLIALSTFALSGFSFVQTHSWAMAGLVLLVLITSMWRFWLPVRFRLSARGVEQRVLFWKRHIPWRAVARTQPCARGILLYPSDDPSPLSLLTTVYIGWREQRQAVLELVDFYTRRLAPPAGSSITSR